MGKKAIRGAKNQLRRQLRGQAEMIAQKTMQQRQTFNLLGALLNRNNGTVVFTRAELDEVNMDRLIDVKEDPEAGTFTVNWAEENGKANITARDILGTKQATPAGEPAVAGVSG